MFYLPQDCLDPIHHRIHSDSDLPEPIQFRAYGRRACSAQDLTCSVAGVGHQIEQPSKFGCCGQGETDASSIGHPARSITRTFSFSFIATPPAPNDRSYKVPLLKSLSCNIVSIDISRAPAWAMVTCINADAH